MKGTSEGGRIRPIANVTRVGTSQHWSLGIKGYWIKNYKMKKINNTVSTLIVLFCSRNPFKVFMAFSASSGRT